MQATRPIPPPGPSRLDKEEPEMANEDDIPADDKKVEGDKWARGEIDGE